MTFWFFALGLPFAAYGAFAVARSSLAAKVLVAFPRNRIAGMVLCAVAWFWTAYELDTIGIEIFDRFLKAFPFELWILAAVLTVLCLVVTGFALRSPGLTSSEVEVNNGGVWVTNTSEGLMGRLNVDARELDARVPDFRRVQFRR